MKNLILALFVISCSSVNSGDEGEFDGSMEAHELAMEMSKQVKEKIENLELASGQNEPADTVLLDSVSALMESFEYWESTIVEVPGHEHHHDHEGHDHDHDHDHSPSPDVTPEQMLEIQKDLLDRITKLNDRAQSISMDKN